MDLVRARLDKAHQEYLKQVAARQQQGMSDGRPKVDRKQSEPFDANGKGKSKGKGKGKTTHKKQPKVDNNGEAGKPGANLVSKGTSTAESSKEVRSGLVCASCGATLSRSRFSGAQLQKKESRRCKECVTASIADLKLAGKQDLVGGFQDGCAAEECPLSLEPTPMEVIVVLGLNATSLSRSSQTLENDGTEGGDMADPARWREYVTSLPTRGAQEVAQLRRRCGQSFKVLRRECQSLACQFRLRATGNARCDALPTVTRYWLELFDLLGVQTLICIII